MNTGDSLRIKNFGTCKIDSPLTKILSGDPKYEMFAEDHHGVLLNILVDETANDSGPDLARIFEVAGPRRKIFFDPSKTRCGIVTCGGLCPGLNDVIRALVRQLWFAYNVRMIYGFRYGYQGFIPKYGHDTLDLTPDAVDTIHEIGGTVLGSSRGAQSYSDIVDCLERMGISILFIVGGDGTLRGGLGIAAEIERRNNKISIVGIPKTIDNDIMYVDESFGFQTAYSKAVEALRDAHAEAKGSPNGIGLVKLMGRYSGFIACHAALAMNDANVVLIPEVPFNLDGEHGLLEFLRDRLVRRHHAVIAVAEGAGQELLEGENGTDASGNQKLKDIGIFLKDRISGYFNGLGMETTLRYIDPSYMIRSVPASPQDSIYCMRLAHNAVHAGMCGKTEMIIGRWHGQYVHVPLQMCISERKRVLPESELWRSVIETSGQPLFR